MTPISTDSSQMRLDDCFIQGLKVLSEGKSLPSPEDFDNTITPLLNLESDRMRLVQAIYQKPVAEMPREDLLAHFMTAASIGDLIVVTELHTFMKQPPQEYPHIIDRACCHAAENGRTDIVQRLLLELQGETQKTINRAFEGAVLKGHTQTARSLSPTPEQLKETYLKAVREENSLALEFLRTPCCLPQEILQEILTEILKYGNVGYFQCLLERKLLTQKLFEHAFEKATAPITDMRLARENLPCIDIILYLLANPCSHHLIVTQAMVQQVVDESHSPKKLCDFIECLLTTYRSNSFTVTQHMLSVAFENAARLNQQHYIHALHYALLPQGLSPSKAFMQAFINLVAKNETGAVTFLLTTIPPAPFPWLKDKFLEAYQKAAGNEEMRQCLRASRPPCLKITEEEFTTTQWGYFCAIC